MLDARRRRTEKAIRKSGYQDVGYQEIRVSGKKSFRLTNLIPDNLMSTT